MSIEEGSLTINGGSFVTYAQAVTLGLTARSGESRPVWMRFQNEGGAFSGWEAFAPTKAWTLSPGAGLKTVTAQLQDEEDSAADTGTPASATIEYLVQSVNGNWMILKMPDYEVDSEGAKKNSYLRLGAPAEGESSLLPHDGNEVRDLFRIALEEGTEEIAAGWFDYTDGNRTSITVGEKKELVGTGYELRVLGGTFDTFENSTSYMARWDDKRRTERGYISVGEFFHGDKESFFGGYQIEALFGLDVDAALGGKLEVSLGFNIECFVGYKLEVGASAAFALTEGKELRVAREFEHKARESVVLRIKPVGTPLSGSLWKASSVAAAVAAGGAGAAAASIGASTSDGAMGGTIAAFGVAIGLSLMAALRSAHESKKSAAEIKMTAGGIEIGHWGMNGAGQEASMIFGEPDGVGGGIRLKNTAGAGLLLESGGTVTLSSPKNVSLHANHGTRMDLNAANGHASFYSKKVTMFAQKVRIAGVLEVKSE
jgi:hypothetical protein